MSKFKLGDKVKCITSITPDEGGPKQGAVFTVTSLENTSWIGFPLATLNDSYSQEIKEGVKANWAITNFELVSQSSRKVVGYKLLKDLPDVKAGVVFKASGREYNFSSSHGTWYSYSQQDVEQEDWFEPIYEQEKVVVELSNGKVEIEEGTVKFIDRDGDVYYYTYDLVKELHKSFISILPSNGFGIQVLTFKVGCQTFTIEDLEKVLKAIPKQESLVKVGLKVIEPHKPDQVYTITNYKEGDYEPYKFGFDGICDRVGYKKEVIEKFLKEGTWTIIN